MNLAELAESLLGNPVVILEDRVCTLPDRPLGEWLTALVTPGFDTIVPGLFAADDAAWAYDRLLDEEDPLDADVCEEAGEWVLEQVTGRPWWEVTRAAALILGAFNPFDAWVRCEAGTDLLSLPLRSAVNLVVRWQLVGRTEEEQGDWLAQFTAEPAVSGQEMAARPEWQDDALEADAQAALDEWARMQAAAGGAQLD